MLLLIIQAKKSKLNYQMIADQLLILLSIQNSKKFKKNQDVCGLAANTNFSRKIKKRKKNPDDAKHISTDTFNKFSGGIFDEKLKQAKLAKNI